MGRQLTDLLGSIPTDEGRRELLDLARQVHDAGRTGAAPQVEQSLLLKLSERIQWHLRAARYALPAPGDLRRMIDEHFEHQEPPR